MKSAAIAALSLLSLASASPVRRPRQLEAPDTVYGVDPSQPFTLTATTADTDEGFTLQPIYGDTFGGTVVLQAVTTGSNATASPAANFTLSASHYGTQLYAWYPGLCTSAAYCPPSPVPNQRWSNDEPVANRPLTFHPGLDEPNFGGLALYGAYRGGDPEAGETNYLVGEGDSDFTAAFALCDWTVNPEIKVLGYHGTNASCEAVTVNAYQVAGY
ncbi:hypothetical protein GGR56DRAFT_672364 [Xylariaceae sp. FL0804]|nr:hypothetical protein GGR56DRAFT_672364 [Xylariaceae sp. FL0804]